LGFDSTIGACAILVNLGKHGSILGSFGGIIPDAEARRELFAEVFVGAIVLYIGRSGGGGG